MGLTEAIEEAHLGRVVRVHRRYPRREQTRLSLYGLVILFVLAGVPVFALWLNHWRFLPGVLFVVGSIALAVIAAPWYLVATRSERYVVTGRGVLVWSPRTGEASRVIPWAAVLHVRGLRVTWRDADERQRSLAVPPVVDRRDLLTAFERKTPVPARAASRLRRIAVVAVLLLPAAGPLVWFGAVPTAVELIRGEQPEDVFALSRMCDGGDPFRGSAHYRGAGPHPVAVVQGGVTDRVIGVRSPDGNWPAGQLMQLVACSRQIGRAQPDALESCSYQPVLTGGALAVNLYQGRYEYTVRQARTGRLVGTVTVDGDPDPKCSSGWAWTEKSPRTDDVDVTPTRAQLDVAFAGLVNGTAPG